METTAQQHAESPATDQIILVELTNDGMFGMKKNQW